MNRKLLNDIRKSMCSRNILLKQKLIDGELSKPQRHNIFQELYLDLKEQCQINIIEQDLKMYVKN